MSYNIMMCVAQYSPILFGMFVFFCVMVVVASVIAAVNAAKGSFAFAPWAFLVLMLVYIITKLADLFATCDPTRPLGIPVLGG